MKQKICAVMFVVCLVVMLGIVGGVEKGAPIHNLLLCIPVGVLVWIFAVLSDLTDF